MPNGRVVTLICQRTGARNEELVSLCQEMFDSGLNGQGARDSEVQQTCTKTGFPFTAKGFPGRPIRTDPSRY
jgi:hypothetical protein